MSVGGLEGEGGWEEFGSVEYRVWSMKCGVRCAGEC